MSTWSPSLTVISLITPASWGGKSAWSATATTQCGTMATVGRQGALGGGQPAQDGDGDKTKGNPTHDQFSSKEAGKRPSPG